MHEHLGGCNDGGRGIQTTPHAVCAVIVPPAPVGRHCCRRFESPPHLVYHFLHSDAELEVSGRVGIGNSIFTQKRPTPI
jgi:hypothetical protein